MRREAEFYRKSGNTLLSFEYTHEALGMLEKEKKLVLKLFGKDSLELARIYETVGKIQFDHMKELEKAATTISRLIDATGGE